MISHTINEVLVDYKLNTETFIDEAYLTIKSELTFELVGEKITKQLSNTFKVDNEKMVAHFRHCSNMQEIDEYAKSKF